MMPLAGQERVAWNFDGPSATFRADTWYGNNNNLHIHALCTLANMPLCHLWIAQGWHIGLQSNQVKCVSASRMCHLNLLLPSTVVQYH